MIEQQLAFGGVTYDAEQDYARLKSQLERVLALCKDGQWRTLGLIAAAVKGSEASVSARLRDLRKWRHGGYIVERKRLRSMGGLYAYRVLPKEIL